MPSNMAANTNHTILLIEKHHVFPLNFGVIIFNVLFNINFWYQQDSNLWSKGSIGRCKWSIDGWYS